MSHNSCSRTPKQLFSFIWHIRTDRKTGIGIISWKKKKKRGVVYHDTHEGQAQLSEQSLRDAYAIVTLGSNFWHCHHTWEALCWAEQAQGQPLATQGSQRCFTPQLCAGTFKPADTLVHLSSQGRQFLWNKTRSLTGQSYRQALFCPSWQPSACVLELCNAWCHVWRRTFQSSFCFVWREIY